MLAILKVNMFLKVRTWEHTGLTITVASHFLILEYV